VLGRAEKGGYWEFLTRLSGGPYHSLFLANA